MEGVNGDWPGSASSPRLVELGLARQIWTDSPSETTRSGPSSPALKHPTTPTPPPKKHVLDNVNQRGFIYIDLTSDPDYQIR